MVRDPEDKLCWPGALVTRKEVVGAEAATQVVADGVKRQSLECQVMTLQWGPLKVLKERKVSSSEQDGRGEAGWEGTPQAGDLGRRPSH